MCCRIQLVPVSPAEAYALLLLIESLPEPRRTQVLERFSDRAARLDDAGLSDVFLDRELALDSEAAREPITHYLSLHLACPFLENDACSIYEFRPFSCREFLVTTPKEMCADPLSQPVARLPLVLFPGKAALDSASAISGRRQLMVPLTLALRYARKHREELEQTYPSSQMLADPIQRALSAAYLALHQSQAQFPEK
jgi:Fe-S-cluster containining protein